MTFPKRFYRYGIATSVLTLFIILSSTPDATSMSTQYTITTPSTPSGFSGTFTLDNPINTATTFVDWNLDFSGTLVTPAASVGNVVRNTCFASFCELEQGVDPSGFMRFTLLSLVYDEHYSTHWEATHQMIKLTQVQPKPRYRNHPQFFYSPAAS